MDSVFGSKQFTEGSVNFGKATREQASMVSLTPGQAAKLLAGKITPMGPGAYEIDDSKIDHLSPNREQPSIKFGAESRFSSNETSTPGPGTYCV
eukprot:gene1939-33350_t